MSLGAYLDVLQGYTLGAVDHDALLGIVHLHVLDADVLHRHLWQAIEVGGTASTTADDVVDVDVAEGWGGLIHFLHIHHLLLLLVAIVEHFYRRLASIVEVEGHHIGLDVKHRHIINVYVLYDTASATGTLEAQADIGAEELAVGYHHVLHATAHLATYHEAAVTLENGASIDNHVLARDATLSAIEVLAALDADTIVAHIKGRVDDEGVLARLQVETIAILCEGRVAYQDILDEHVLTHQRMDVPGRRVLEDDTIEPNVLAADEADHHRTEVILHLVPTFLGGDAERHVHARTFLVCLHGSLRREPIVGILEGTATRGNLLPLSRSYLGFLQRTPIFAVSIDGTLTGDCHILQVATGDRRLAAACVQALKGCLYEWVEIDVGREEDDATFLYM